MKKGSFGYISFMKKKSAVTAILMSSAAALVYYAGLKIFPDNRTLVGIMTVLISIPAAMAVVRFIMFMRFKSGDSRIRDRVEEIRGIVPVFYDSILTTSDKSYGVNVFISAEQSLLGLSLYDGFDIEKVEKHLRGIYDGLHMQNVNIKVFTDEDKFYERLKTLSARYTPEPPVSGEDGLLHVIGRISL